MNVKGALEGKCRVLTMNTCVTTLDDSVVKVIELSKKNMAAYVCVSNVHMCIESFNSVDFRSVVNQADWVIPDGRPIYWAQKLLGYSGASQVRGQDIMLMLCKLSGEKALNIGLFGGSSDQVLARVVAELKNKYPDVRLNYFYSPPFREMDSCENAELVRAIHEANVDVLFVGLGCPKQERWMAEHKANLNCVMLGVGAAFDFIAGSKRHAPRWMQKIGMEWFFRFLSEPFRLYRRYLTQNPKFIYHFSRQWLFNKSF